jgi:hypothetical protein
VSEQDSSGSGVRASDAQRDAVVGRLNRAVGEGRLTMDEFSGRLELAYAARTRGDLDPLLRDLPADSGGVVPAVTSGTAAVSGGGRGSDTHWNISPIGGIRHRGHWRVPRHAVAIGVLGGRCCTSGRSPSSAA